MHRSFAGIALALLAACHLAAPAAAQGLDGLKIAVVNVNEALNRSAAGERSKSILLTSKSQLETELKEKEDALRRKLEALEKNIMLSDQARTTRQRELREEERALRQEVQNAQRELQGRERKLTESIFIELRTVIDAIAKEEKFDLVLEQNAAGVILFSKVRFHDITDQVIERYNKFNASK